MCGRVNISDFDFIPVQFNYQIDFDTSEDFFPIYNGCPGQYLPVFLDKQPEKLVKRHWGFMPSWWKEEKLTTRWINSQSENLLSSNMWKPSFEKKRCIVPVNGFYEWKAIDTPENLKKTKPLKQPYFIYSENAPISLLAGLWNCWTNKLTGEQIETFSIITTHPSQRMTSFHNRMPVILNNKDVEKWFDPKCKIEDLTNIFLPKENINAYKVSLLKGNEKPEILGNPVF